MDSQTYRFADFSLDPAARELRRNRQLLSVPPRIFDAITYLIEHRDRAVGRDELISALWGRVDVADRQVAQLIMRARQVIGQNGDAEPEAIRTIYGFGYRWVWDICSESPAVAEPVEANAPSASQASEPRPKPKQHRTFVLRRLGWLAAGVVVLATVGAGVQTDASRARFPAVAADIQRQTAAVLPVETHAPESADVAWIRLGIMDLISERLRRSGLAVPPSDGVVSALHAMNGLSAEERQAQLERTLATDLVVDGKATRTEEGWTVELTALSPAEPDRRAEATASDIVPAANHATDLLLVALGRDAAPNDDRSEALSEVLQRAKAAILAQEIDLAREVLVSAPASMRNAPVLRVELALVEYYAGKFGDAEAIVTALLDDPEVAADPRLHARVLMTRGTVERAPHGNWAEAEKWFDAAVESLDQASWAPELAEALAVRAIARVNTHDFDAAALDLGRARTLFDAGGNRLGLGRVQDYLGRLELERGRLTEALPHFRAAIEINESFGQVRRLTANLSGLLAVQMQSLQWRDALATSERLRSMDDRITNPVWRHAIGSQRALVLIALGRHDEAERVLDELAREDPSLINICEERGRVRLAWQRGRLDETRVAATTFLEHHASERTDEPLGDIALLLQRASMVASESDRIGLAPEDAASDPAYLVARAEWATQGGDDAEAERAFRQAMTAAESRAAPDAIVLVADAYGRWLIKQGRIPDASAVAGRIAGWAESDYDSAMLQVAVLHAAGQRTAWAAALRQAQKLAGEREIAASLVHSPDAGLAAQD
jgi:DNA-binding winged helix-turn-helix (wHTH) protein/tetratricopeptide (TPR) repeat protein